MFGSGLKSFVIQSTPMNSGDIDEVGIMRRKLLRKREKSKKKKKKVKGNEYKNEFY